MKNLFDFICTGIACIGVIRIGFVGYFAIMSLASAPFIIIAYTLIKIWG